MFGKSVLWRLVNTQTPAGVIGETATHYSKVEKTKLILHE